ncbi:MAG: type II toxin-antitoxin system VapC family toxin [Anaerolineales bacterium]|uniref:Type II toxin-antitoxin system VapC family toxin n=1 Tax=Candidatus Desulfolinea nitratireducens TaxID=2841698 RepID=A0A8J6NL92_9CHLR|nr:type II toxin-antitoxin system VapC family toxin [Candidatus Desulfolinea nitratireducens]MBL6961090.1 type II toxin-antitoxin system VapC family toxin [Anaerolineales bacterium]
MSEDNLRWVVDASVGIKLFVNEEFSDKVHRFFIQLTEEIASEFYVPDLFYIECANILLKYTRRFNRPLEDAQADLIDLNKLILKTTPTSDLIEDSLLLASVKKLSAYDAAYAVLAQKLDLPLITADVHLARSIDWAVWIGDLDF